MKAVLYERFGPPEVLHIKEIEKPAPGAGQVLVRVYATTVTIGDTIMRSLDIPLTGLQRVLARLYLGLRKPRRPILGMELAGDIEAVGRKVTRFKAGDAVFASTFSEGFGGYAEYKCLKANGALALMPANLSYHEAAALPGAGMTALQCLQKANISPGQRVLVYGASGAVGTNAVQLAARHFGAEVTGVCSTANLELAASLGASRVIDYTRPDFSLEQSKYDVVFDAVGKLPRPQAQLALRQDGVYLNVHLHSDGGNRLESLLILKGLAEAGTLKAVIDRVYPLEQIVAAHRYVEQGHKKGNVVITVRNE